MQSPLIEGQLVTFTTSRLELIMLQLVGYLSRRYVRLRCALAASWCGRSRVSSDGCRQWDVRPEGQQYLSGLDKCFRLGQVLGRLKYTHTSTSAQAVILAGSRHWQNRRLQYTVV